MWLRKLLETSCDPRTVDRNLARVQNVHDLLKPMLPPRALGAYYERLASQRAPHRAGPDSARYASALRAAFQAR
jgi:hypothetical protein